MSKLNQILIVFVSILLFSCVSEKPVKDIITKENDLTKLKLNGSVQNLIENTYKSAEESGEIVKGELMFKDVFSFNEKGFFIEKNRFNQSNETYNKNYFIYDEYDNLIEEKRYYSDDKLSGRTVYVYDAENRLIEENSYNSEGELTLKTIYVYNEKGDLVERTQTNAKENIIEKLLIVYDESGNQTESHHWPVGDISGPLKTQNFYDDKGKVSNSILFDTEENIKQKRFFTYNEKRGKAEEIRFDAEDKLINTIKTAYDNEGNMIEYILLDPDGNVTLEQSFTFENFDEKGNWLLKVNKRSSDNSLIFEREIVYY